MTPRTLKNRTVRARGFTLVELLAVMLILAVLMTLVVGAARLLFGDVYKKETKATMAIVMTAITEFQQDTGAYPTQGSSGSWIAQLAGNEKSKVHIAKLDANVWSPSNNSEIRDAWGNPIVYKRTGGLAGAPGLISPGSDGDIDTEEDNVQYNK